MGRNAKGVKLYANPSNYARGTRGVSAAYRRPIRETARVGLTFDVGATLPFVRRIRAAETLSGGCVYATSARNYPQEIKVKTSMTLRASALVRSVNLTA